MKKAVFLYDYTGLAAQAWLDHGYQCFIVDAQHPAGVSLDAERPGLVKVGLWLNRDAVTVTALTTLVGGDVAFLAGFPPCDDMAVSGARWFAEKLAKDPDCQKRAADRARLVEDLGLYWNCPWFAENPVSVLSTLWRKPNHTFEPWHYAGYLPPDDVHPAYPGIIPAQDRYPKQTCLWTGNGFVMPPKRPLPPLQAGNPGWTKLGGKSARTKEIRSATPRGFSLAVFESNGRDNVPSLSPTKDPQ